MATRRRKKSSGLPLVAAAGLLCLLALVIAIILVRRGSQDDSDLGSESIQTAREALARGDLDLALENAADVLGDEESSPEARKLAQDISSAAGELQDVRKMWQAEKRYATTLGLLNQMSARQAEARSAQRPPSEPAPPDLDTVIEAEKTAVLAEQNAKAEALGRQGGDLLARGDLQGALEALRAATAFELGGVPPQRKASLDKMLQQAAGNLQLQALESASAGKLADAVGRLEKLGAFLHEVPGLLADPARWDSTLKESGKQLRLEKEILDQADQAVASGNAAAAAKLLDRGAEVRHARVAWSEMAARLESLRLAESAASSARPTPARPAKKPLDSPEAAVFEPPPMEPLELEQLAQTAFEVEGETRPIEAERPQPDRPAASTAAPPASSSVPAAADTIGAELQAIDTAPLPPEPAPVVRKVPPTPVVHQQPTPLPELPLPTEVPPARVPPTEVPPARVPPTEVPVAEVSVAEVPVAEVPVVEAPPEPVVVYDVAPSTAPLRQAPHDPGPRSPQPRQDPVRPVVKPTAARPRPTPAAPASGLPAKDGAKLERQGQQAQVGRQFYSKGRELEVQAESHKDKAYYRIAIEAYDKVPDDAERIVYVQSQARAGRLLSYQLRDYAQAVTHFERAVRKDSRHPLLHYELGYAAFHLGRFDEAINAFSRVGIFAGINPEEVKDYPRLELQMFFLNALAHEARAARKDSDPLLLRDAISAWQSYLDSCRVAAARCDEKRRSQAESHIGRLRDWLRKSLAAKVSDTPE